ncbi:MAG: hypothetical protein JWM34_4644 [Ilumatobacteraceae bacterium]|nr:hypothetical protein [Ilumatobacteraceae bacterium]
MRASFRNFVAIVCGLALVAPATVARADGWDYVYGDPGPANYSRYQDVELAPDGSTYIAGFYSGTFYGLSSPNAYRYFLQHLRVDGTVDWTREVDTSPLDTQTLPASPDLFLDGLSNPIVRVNANWWAYTSAGVVLHTATVGFVQPAGFESLPVAPAPDGGGVVIVRTDASGYQLQHRRADLSLQWSFDLSGLVDDSTQCTFCKPAVIAVPDGTFWVVGQKNRVLVTQQDGLSLVHVSASGNKIASILQFGVVPYVAFSGGSPVVAATPSYIWVSTLTGTLPSGQMSVRSYAANDGHELGTVNSVLPSEDIPTGHGSVNCGGLSFSGEAALSGSPTPYPKVLRRTVLLGGTRLVVVAQCNSQVAAPAVPVSATLLLSYEVSDPLGGQFALQASRELSTSSNVSAMAADDVGNAVVVGSTTDGVVYAGPIARPTRTETAGNEQAVAARNPLGNLTDIGDYTGLTPVRIFDTRPGQPDGAVVVPKSKVGGASVLTVPVAGKLGVPANGAGAVSLNVTVVDPDGPGYLTVYPCGTPPNASNLNFVAGQTVANAVIAPLSSSGTICIASNVAVHVLADINGWFRSGLGFTVVQPLRVFDTRPDQQQGAVSVDQHPYGGPVELKVKVTGVGGVPSTNVGAVSLNVTAVGPVGAGYVTVYPCGTRPNASNLNFVAGQTVPNAVLAPVSANGEICLYSSVDTHLLADVNGWFSAGSSFSALNPVRLVDTRPTEAQGAVTVVKQKYGPGTILHVKVTGVGGVPTDNVGAVALNVTVVDPEAAGYVTAFPCGQQPLASNVNFVLGQTVPNAVLVPVSSAGEVCLYSNVSAHILVDVNGWIALAPTH